MDLSGEVQQVIPNEKNYIHNEMRFPGGNSVNVARLLTKFSIPVQATGFLGGGVGTELEQLLDLEGVIHDFVNIEGDTRISITVSVRNSHQQTRFSFPGPKIEKEAIAQLFKKILKIPRGSWLAIGGSFPPGFRPSHVNEIIRLGKSRNLFIALDVPGPLLKKIKLDGVSFIKPNLVELEEMFGKKFQSTKSIITAARTLTNKVKFVCISSVNDGAVLVTKNSAWFGKAAKVKIRSTVGAGDSMNAGFLVELCRQQKNSKSYNYDLLAPHLLRNGLAFASATLTTEGTQLGNSRDIKRLYSRVKIDRID